jgi:ABC-type uncharacterized transport system auxiliary subunit
MGNDRNLMPPNVYLRFWPALALGLALAACAGPPPPTDSFYRLQASPTVQHFAKPALPGVVEVERLSSDAVLGDRALTFAAKEGGPLEHYHYDFWSEPPGILMQDQLARALRQAGAADRVVTPDLRVLADWTVRGKIRRFEQVANAGKVVVEMDLGVVATRDGSLVLLEPYAATSPVSGSGVEAVVTAMDKSVADIIARFVADLGRARATGANR